MKSKTSRTKHSPAFKAKVALAALREQEPVAEIARRYKVHANVVYKWRRQLVHAVIAKCGILTSRSLPEGVVIVIRAEGASARTEVLFDSGQGERSPGGLQPDRGECGQARRGSHSSGVLVQPSECHGQAAGRGGVPVPADVWQVLGAVRGLLVLLPRSPLLRA